MSIESDQKAKDYLAISSQYKLGTLITESSHPDTRDLSNLANNDLHKAISILKSLDCNTLSILAGKVSEICYLKDAVNVTLRSGNNIFFCGCGATGRLSLTIETLWRQVHCNEEIKDRVFSFMSGGDVALIRSIENFEDFPQYGARQLEEAGFKDGDLLIATTEGGETPFVIGATEKAAQISYRKPFFLYCNPDDELCRIAERSKLVIENPNIEKINLTVGPMAITGSTRMQSSTILLAAAGIALFFYNDKNEAVIESINALEAFWDNTDISFIEKFITTEANYYKNNEYLLYESDNQLGITIITDTTERSPTFSLFPFENVNELKPQMSLCYLYMPSANNSEEAWRKLLWRNPRTLEWPDISGIASEKRLVGFDFSRNVLSRRKNGNPSTQHCFRIIYENNGISFSLGGENHFIDVPFKNPLFIHLLLKMILNIHSTLIMGRLGRYEGNIMTYVRASNNKLIDRSVRYIDLIIREREINLSYDELVHILFEMLEKTPTDQAIVLTTVAEIKKRYS